ncbi:MAG: transcription-repair coupling factor [Lachnospiraceae bacterium]
MKALIEPLRELAEFDAIKSKRMEAPGMIQIAGCVNSQKTHLAYALGDDCLYKIIAVSSELKAKQIYEELKMLEEDVYLYPVKDLLFYHADLRGKYVTKQRMEVIQALVEKDTLTVIVSFEGFMDTVLPFEEIKERLIKLSPGNVIDFEKLKEDVVLLGYEREEQIEGPGQFAVRGGILDIYPLTEEVPIRIEMWGDEIDSIRTFDIKNQLSIENLNEVLLYPATEFEEEQEDKVSFLDYFSTVDTLLFLDEPSRLKEKGSVTEEELSLAYEKRMAAEEEMCENIISFSANEVIAKMNRFCSIGFTAIEMKQKEFKLRDTVRVQANSVNPYNNSFETLTKDLQRYKKGGYKVVLLSGSRTRAKRLAEDLRDYGLSSFYSEDLEREVNPGGIMTAYGHVTEGYEYPLLKFIVISETDIFGRKKKKKKKRKTYEGQQIQSFSELKVGDYVVHENHGLGIYQGIENMEVDWIQKDYMKIAYAGGGNLYIPATQLNLIQKYGNSEVKKPKLNSLGGQEWIKSKNKVKKAVHEIAKDLVELYAKRQEKDGFVYGPDTIWQKEFEEMFPFEETEDQLLAIQDTKRDMESPKIMDRLICGDVGYGKTEIAIRAAFKAVQESKQVVYLVPTTILAQQHYNTFVQRLKDFPVRVDLMCRFRTPSEQKKTIQDLKKGLVDIVIGTHRVLSRDVRFKDLGLLVIDEEQRFGVRHKEVIKKLKENVDVLTLTATPIPRTLHMSLIGIRDMSVLEEPPMDRMPIQTYVMEYNEEMVREAIAREMARDGQVYYVYNRVEDIADITARIQNLVPEAMVAYAHGQMREHQLERIMYNFINGDVDVLVSTTIIETGLDISNVNTIIIHDSDRMGLAQLYQLRGRVGRSNRMAYAFLLYRRNKMLREVAEKRLTAIREFTDLGSGFKIAMRDLEIRGAGNLLGDSQHGHMEAVGYDLYCKMLNEAVKQEQGIMAEEEIFNTTVELNVDAFIPASYISNENQKLDVYKRIAAIENETEIDNMLEELIDRFGDVPKSVQQLLSIAGLKALAHQVYVTAIEQKEDQLKFIMYEKAQVMTDRIPLLLEKYKNTLTFRVETNPYFTYREVGRNRTDKGQKLLDVVKNVLNDIKTLIE